jgi:hypothetical protein
MYPINILGKSYVALDFVSPGYERKIKQFVADCSSYFSGKQYGTEFSGHHSAYFAGSYNPTIASATFNGCLGGNRILIGMQVVIVSLNAQKIGYGVVTSATVVSSIDGAVTKNFTVQVTHRHNYSAASPSSGWVILPGPFPFVDSTTILSQELGGSGGNSIVDLREIVGTVDAGLTKATYFEDFEGISQTTNASSYLTAQADGILPPNMYAPCAGAGTVSFTYPAKYHKLLSGNTVGVANLSVRNTGDQAAVLAATALVAYPGVGSVFTSRFMVCPSEGYQSTDNYTLKVGLCGYGIVGLANIPNIVTNHSFPSGVLFDRQVSTEQRSRREYNGQNINHILEMIFEHFCWYKLRIANQAGSLVLSIRNEKTGELVSSAGLGTTAFVSGADLCVPFAKIGKTAGSSEVILLVDYLHWKLPGERAAMPP